MNKTTENQMKKIKELCSQLDKKFNSVDYENLSQSDSFSLIADMIKKANGSVKESVSYDKEYSISFQCFVKSACELYKGTGKTFKKVVEEVKKVY